MHCPLQFSRVRALSAGLLGLALGLGSALPSDAQDRESVGVRCPDGYAIVDGPPARELFDPYAPNAGRAVWCERYDVIGRPFRHGAYRDFHPDGSPRSYARFHADKLSGVVLVLHDNGRPWLHTIYRAGKLHGPYVVFTPTGSPWIEAEYEHGRPTGLHIQYFEAGGVAAISQYRGGHENGVSRTWYPNGQRRQEIEVVKDLWSGRFSTWHENGHAEDRGYYAPCPSDAVASSCRHLGSARHGPWRTWHENGTQASQGEWQFGERVGPWLYWTPAGKPTATDVTRGPESSEEAGPPPASPAPIMVPRGVTGAGATGRRTRPVD